MISIHPRVPALQELIFDQVKVGGAEFQKAFLVQSSRPDAVRQFVSTRLEEVLLDHIATASWHMLTRIAGRRVLVTTTWARNADQWEYLIAKAEQIRDAVPANRDLPSENR
jgi:hypothetical protein